MILSDGTVLMHQGLPYDPAKAHEYYLRTRQLKGRHAGGGSYTVNRGHGHTVRLSAQQLREQQIYAAAQVSHLKKKLGELSVLLHEKMRKAKAAQATAAKPPTAAEKAKAARDAQAYRNSHKQSIAAKAKAATAKKPATKAKTPDTVDSLKKQIGVTKTNLKAAVQKQRELATARKNG